MKFGTLSKTVTRLAAATFVTSALMVGVGAHATRAAEVTTIAKPDLINIIFIRGEKIDAEVNFIDKANNEEGYEAFARIPTSDGSIHVSSRTVPGAIAGTENVGYITLQGLTPSTRYCFSARAYRLHPNYDWSAKSNEICFTTPAAQVVNAPAPAPASTPAPVAAIWPTLRLGAQGENVTTMQYLLREHDGDALTADGSFGPLTLQAVKVFQTDQGLTVDGIVGPQTWQKLAVTLRQGDQGEAVIALQRQLTAHGHTVTDDSDFGPQTAAAVRSFQQSKGLVVDGIVGPRTWQALLT